MRMAEDESFYGLARREQLEQLARVYERAVFVRVRVVMDKDHGGFGSLRFEMFSQPSALGFAELARRDIRGKKRIEQDELQVAGIDSNDQLLLDRRGFAGALGERG